MSALLYIWPKLTTVGKWVDEMHESFENGKEFGFSQAIETVQQIKFHRCSEVSDDEVTKLRNFLIENNLEMVYSLHDGGLRVRRLMPKNEHEKEMYLRAIKETNLRK